LRGLAIRFHFSGEIAQGGLGLRAMLAVFVPIVRPQGKKTPAAISATSMTRLRNDLRCSPPRKLMRESMAKQKGVKIATDTIERLVLAETKGGFPIGGAQISSPLYTRPAGCS